MGTLEVRLFGTMSIERDGQPLERFPSKRVRDLLSYLLLGRDSTHSREHLAGLFWGDLDDRRARHSFNTALWRLHRALGQHQSRANPYLQVDGQRVGFNTASDYRLDVAEFEQRCAWAEQLSSGSDQSVKLLRQATGYYRGDLLTDCYDDWCLVERERLRRLYLRALDQLRVYHTKRGDLTSAIDCALRVLTCDPLREEVHRDLMQLYLAANQPAAALRQYRLCEATLERELGIDPMPETKALLHRLIERGSGLVLAGSAGPNREERSTGSRQLALNLAAALDHLDEAAQQVNQAFAQLEAARALVEGAIRDLGAAGTTEPAGVGAPAPTVPHLRQARDLMADSANRIAGLTMADASPPS